MKRLLTTELGQLRVVSMLEGVSYLLLLGIAMPLKYLGGDPSLVRVLGPIHGLLFVVLVVAIARAAVSVPWRWQRVLLALVAAVTPFGAFVLDRSLRAEQRAS